MIENVFDIFNIIIKLDYFGGIDNLLVISFVRFIKN